MKNIFGFSFIKFSNPLVKILLIGSMVGGILFGIHSFSRYLPQLGEYILTSQLELVGFTVHQIGGSQVGWRDACFKNIVVSPSFLKSLETLFNIPANKELTQYLVIKEIEIHYTPKDLILRRFRDVYVEGVQGILSLGNPPSVNQFSSASKKQKFAKKISFSPHYMDLSVKRSNKIDIKDAHFYLLTPMGVCQVGIEMSLTDFFTRKVLGNGRIIVQGPQGSIDGMIKVDKIEHRLWRLTMDISNGIFEMPWIIGSDINSHLEILIAPRHKYINGHIHFSYLSLPYYFKNTFSGFETDFKYTLDENHSLKGDILMKIPQLRLYDAKGYNGHCRLHFSGNFDDPFDHLKGNFSFDEVDIGSYLKPAHLKGFIRLNNKQLEIEGMLNRTPLALNFLLKHHLKEETGSITMNALSPLIFKRGGLLLSYFSPKLSDYLDKFEGMVSFKCEGQWDKDHPDFAPLFTVDSKNVSFHLHDIKIKNMDSRFIFNHFFNDALIEFLMIEKMTLPNTKLNSVNIQGRFAFPLIKVEDFKATINDSPLILPAFELNLTKKISNFLPFNMNQKVSNSSDKGSR